MPTSKPQVVFHFPRPIVSAPAVGSDVHVRGMLSGMQAIADVEIVDGYSGERTRTMRRLAGEIGRGRSFAAVFSEASTTPTGLNDPHHVPRRLLADARFFRRARRSGIPVGLFYPDVHWRFEHYRQAVSAPVRAVTTSAYRFDLSWYRRSVDVLFMPSLEMAASVPGWASDHRVAALPPGGDNDPLPWQPNADGRLRLLYVGGVSPPLYDITALIRTVRELDHIELVICCPAQQRAFLVEAEHVPNIAIVHEAGPALRVRYAECDIACLVYPDYPYRRFAMPVKLFEALGVGRPLIISAGNSAARFAAASGLGWVVEPDGEDLRLLLERLRSDPGEVATMHDRVVAAAPAHTWEARAAYVLDRLGVPLSRQSRPR